MMAEDKKLLATCEPDYKREYYRLAKENAQLIAENNMLRKIIVEMCKLVCERR